MIFHPEKQPGYLYLSLLQPLSKVLKFLFSLHWLNLRCSHHLHFSPIYATFMQKQCCREPGLLPAGPAGMAAINASLAVGRESCTWGARKKGSHKCVTSPTVLQGGKLVWKHRYQHLQAYHSRALGMSVALWSPYPVLPRFSSNSGPVQYSQGCCKCNLLLGYCSSFPLLTGFCVLNVSFNLF